jgi:CRP-like cAMP-binding protein
MLSGKVRVSTVDEDQQEVIVDEPARGEFFGFASMLEQTRNQTNAIALEETSCIEVSRDDLRVFDTGDDLHRVPCEPGFVDQKSTDRAVHDPQRLARRGRIAGEQEAQRKRNAQYPLTHRYSSNSRRTNRGRVRPCASICARKSG